MSNDNEKDSETTFRMSEVPCSPSHPLKSCHWLCNVCILLHSKPETLPNHLKRGFKRTFLS